MRRLLRSLLLALCALALAGCPDDGGSQAVDTDEDGFTDDAEVEAGSDPDDSFSVPDDRDGDGVSNASEEDAGTDPDDPADFPGAETDPDEADPDETDPDETGGDPADGADPGSSSPCEGDGCPQDDSVAASCDAATFSGCGEFEVETQCTNHGDNGPILTTDHGGFSDVLLTISNAADLPDDAVIQLVYLDEDAERVSLPVTGATLKATGSAYFVVPIQEADKAHTFSHVLVDGERVDIDAGSSLDFTSGPFTETGRCTAEEIDAAKTQVEADGTAV